MPAYNPYNPPALPVQNSGDATPVGGTTRPKYPDTIVYDGGLPVDPPNGYTYSPLKEVYYATLAAMIADPVPWCMYHVYVGDRGDSLPKRFLWDRNSMAVQDLVGLTVVRPAAVTAGNPGRYLEAL